MDLNQTHINRTFEPNWDIRIESFDGMGLKTEILRGIFRYGLETPSEIQSLVIKPIIDGKNVISQAHYMTGKTIAFLIGIINSICTKDATTQALLVFSRRELATEAFHILNEFGHYLPDLTIGLFKGGGSDTSRSTNKPHIIVATPGRILDLTRRRVLSLDNIKIWALDEADEMFWDGFREQVESISQYLHKNVQTLFISTNPSPIVLEVFNRIAKDPVKILLKADMYPLDNIKQYFLLTENGLNKEDVLFENISRVSIHKAIIFVNSRIEAEFLNEQFLKSDYSFGSIHTGLFQDEKEKIISDFKSGVIKFLISTDDFSRILHFPDITLVINVGLPTRVENYYPRFLCSRNYGCKMGITINIICPNEKEELLRLENYYHTSFVPLLEDMISIGICTHKKPL